MSTAPSPLDHDYAPAEALLDTLTPQQRALMTTSAQYLLVEIVERIDALCGPLATHLDAQALKRELRQLPGVPRLHRCLDHGGNRLDYEPRALELAGDLVAWQTSRDAYLVARDNLRHTQRPNQGHRRPVLDPPQSTPAGTRAAGNGRFCADARHRERPRLRRRRTPPLGPRCSCREPRQGQLVHRRDREARPLMAVTKRARYEVLRRDNFACRYCGLRAGETELTVDHVMPVALGGTDKPDNLVACCRVCNAGKTSVPPDAPLVENVAEDALRWAAAMRWAAEQQADARYMRESLVTQFDKLWRECKYPDGTSIDRPATWRSTVENWYSSGVEIETLEALIEPVMSRGLPDHRVWPYFCGAVRNVMRERVEIARGYLDETAGA